MTHNWKPGDLALRTGPDGTTKLSFFAPRCHEMDRPHWHNDNGTWNPAGEREEYGTYRPLLVIDPEDRAQIMRLANVFCQTPSSGWVDQMQAALRTLLEPELEEPTTWLAVVRDGAGEEWYRRDECGDKRSWGHRRGERADSAWSDLPRPLTVLSPGYVEGADS